MTDVLTAASDTLRSGFAASLDRDWDAAGRPRPILDHKPCEGQVNRIKTVKRIMYGRAGFQLLRALPRRQSRRGHSAALPLHSIQVAHVAWMRRAVPNQDGAGALGAAEVPLLTPSRSG